MTIKKGDLVIGALWDEGDPKDPWAIGIYDGLNEASGRHAIVDDNGDAIRFGGFRRVEPVRKSSATFMQENISSVNQANGISVFAMAKMTTKKLREIIN